MGGPVGAITFADATVAASGAYIPTTYHGFSLRNTSAVAAATVRLRDGGAAGTILDTIQLGASESAREFYERGEGCSGIYMQLVAGAVEGSVRAA